ncbi:MAG: hypothetical protein AUK47_23270 [Deltaproteobacteria bacterium CG2_30_63_29]|nr:MAG: hypothetical protein AUK47_23270 [Deltaproteobacteria bacterium CG2_30_63_29]PIW00066.1 MAG: hypothetical protein COW42_09025 [Deltaproteobacteria bacterium CG17_big_fil_post_rev_8_21_14_2_50_63_7]
MARPPSPLELYLERTLEMFVSSGDVDGLALSTLRLARLRHAADAGSESVESLLNSALMALEGYDRRDLRARLFLSYAEFGCGDAKHRALALDEAERLWAEYPEGLVSIDWVRADADVAAGHLDRAAQRHGQAAARLRAAGIDPNLVAEQVLIQASLHRLRRDPVSALDALCAVDVVSCLPPLRAAFVEQRGWATLERGQAGEALALARQALSDLGDEDDATLSTPRGKLSLLLADAALATGDVDTALEAVEALESLPTTDAELQCHISLCRAEVHLARGDRTAAMRHERLAAKRLANTEPPPQVLSERLEDLRQALATSP